MGLLTRHFRSGVYCRREELLLVQRITFNTFYMHKCPYKTLKEREQMKYDRSPLIIYKNRLTIEGKEKGEDLSERS